MNRPPIIFVAMAVVIALLATRQYFNKRRQEAINDKAPQMTQQVKVYGKRKVPSPSRRSRDHENIVNESFRYELYVEKQLNAEKMKLIVNQKQFESVPENSVGQLTLQGTRFIAYVVSERQE